MLTLQFIFFKVVLAVLGCFLFSVSFRMKLSISTKKPDKFLIGIYESVINSGRIDILTILSLSLHDQDNIYAFI